MLPFFEGRVAMMILLVLLWVLVSGAIMEIGNAVDSEAIMITGAVLLLLSFTIIV